MRHKDEKIALMTSNVDDRSGVGTVASRIGLHRKAVPISEDLDLFNYVSELNKSDVSLAMVGWLVFLIDEAQFLKRAPRIRMLPKLLMN